MASDSVTPPPSTPGGGAAKIVVVLLVLVAGGLGVFMATRPPEPAKPDAPPPPPKIANVERSTALVEETLEIPEPEPDDAGVVADEPAPTAKRHPRNGPPDTWSCQGDIPAAEIKHVLADANTQIRACYEKRLRSDNVLQGNVNLQVRIGTDGKVAATRTHGSMKDRQVLDCVEGLAKRWSFPAPAGGNCAVFDAPYTFTPKTN